MRKQVMLIIFLLNFFGGCKTMTYPAYILFGDHHPKVKAEYEGLAQKRSVLIIVGHPGIDFEFPTITTNLALMGANQIRRHVEGVSFVEQEKVEAFQQQSSQWIGLEMDQVKKNLNAQRLIYIELIRLTLLENDSVNLLRGRLIANVKVYDLEVAPNDHPVYETEIQIVVPKVVSVYLSDSAQQHIQQKLMAEFAVRLAWKFYDHNEERK